MKDLIKKILKEENDFDWVRNTNPISKDEIANELSDLQDWGYFIQQRRVESSSLVSFIYRLGLDAKELREKSLTDLQTEKQSLLREQFNLRMQRATGQLNQTHRFKQIRREVARINTIMNEKRRGAA